MLYRRNADSRLRDLERRYQASSSRVDRNRLSQELARLGMPGLTEEIIEALEAERNVVSYQRINIHENNERYLHHLKERGDDPYYQVINSFLAFEVKKISTDDSIDPDQLEAAYDRIAQTAIGLNWPVVLDKIYLRLSWEDRSRISYFLGDENFNFGSITSSQDIDHLIDIERLENVYDRELDEYELDDRQNVERRLRSALQEARLRRKLYVINPDLMKPNTGISNKPPFKGRRIASHMGRYETMLHKALIEYPDKYVVYWYNIQSGGYGGGKYFNKDQYDLAVEEYLRSVVRID